VKRSAVRHILLVALVARAGSAAAQLPDPAQFADRGFGIDSRRRGSGSSLLAARLPAGQRRNAQRVFDDVLVAYREIESNLGLGKNDPAGAIAALVAGCVAAPIRSRPRAAGHGSSPAPRAGAQPEPTPSTGSRSPCAVMTARSSTTASSPTPPTPISSGSTAFSTSATPDCERMDSIHKLIPFAPLVPRARLVTFVFAVVLLAVGVPHMFTFGLALDHVPWGSWPACCSA
jgi:hypothetical protein